MRIREIMVVPVVTVRENATLEEVALTMLEHRVGCVPVVDERGRLAGIITESDFTAADRCVPFSTFRAPQLFGRWLGRDGLLRLYGEARSTLARDAMTREVVTVGEDESIEHLARLMIRHDLKRIPVVRGEVPVGIVTRHDLLKLMARPSPRSEAGGAG